jgi:hypothetical protein
MRSQNLLLYWQWIMELPENERQGPMLQLLHQIIIELENLERQ